MANMEREGGERVELSFYFKVRAEVAAQIEKVVNQEMVEFFGNDDFSTYVNLFLDSIYGEMGFEDEYSMRRRVNAEFEELIEMLLLDISSIGGEFDEKTEVKSFIENSKVNEPFIPDLNFTGDAVRYYLIEAMDHRLLTTEEEVMLARKVQRGAVAKRIGFRTKILNKIVLESLVAREDLVNHNQRLVVNFVKGRVRSDSNVGDLIQEGNLGLLRAVDKFDPERGIRFSTYATWWIKQFIARGSVKDGSQIWIPGHIRDRISLVRKAESKLIQNGGVSLEKVVKMTGLLPKQVDEVYRVLADMKDLIELDRPLGGDGDVSFGEMQEDISSDSTGYREEQTRLALLAITDGLPKRHADMVRLRFGLYDGDAMTFAEIGEKYGISKQRVSQIVEFSIKALSRDEKAKSILEEYLSES